MAKILISRNTILKKCLDVPNYRILLPKKQTIPSSSFQQQLKPRSHTGREAILVFLESHHSCI